MPNKSNHRRLEHLIRLAGMDEPVGFAAPSDEIVQRYLLGTASAGERAQVRHAIESSSEFRREILLLAEDVDRACETRVGEAYNVQKTSHPACVSHSRPWFMRLPIALPLAAAATVILALIGRTLLEHESHWTLVESSVEAERLMPLDTRGSGHSPTAYPSEREAAMAQFRHLLRWTDDGFRFEELPADSVVRMSGQDFRLRLHDQEGRTLGDWSVSVPADSAGIWLLTLPERDLYHMTVYRRKTTAVLKQMVSQGGCIVWTYQTKEGFRAAPSVTFEAAR